MTATATLVQQGPIKGMFTEKAALYELSQPHLYDGQLFDHLVISSIEEDHNGPWSTIAVVASPQGFVFLGTHYPYTHEGPEPDGHGHEAALAALGYELVG